MKKKENEVVIFETKYWRVVLIPQQRYLGRCVLVLKRPCGNPVAMDRAEQNDLFDAMSRLDQMFKRAFGSTMFNFSCHMNDAYRETRPKPQVHIHFRPRYEAHVRVEIGGLVFEDPNFGDHSVGDEGERKVTKEVLEAINERLHSI